MELSTVWFILIAVLWIGYFFLEGFDFGVGILLGTTRKDTERRVLINTIGPVWDGNEVWLLVAGGATFAAFPEWYATLFSGFYLPLLLILLSLIVRACAFEYRGKIDSTIWRRNWDIAIIVSSTIPALLWGVAFANIVRGVPIDGDKEFTGTIFTLLNPYGLLGGLTTLSLFILHGLMFVMLKTHGEVAEKAHKLTRIVGPVALVIAAAFVVITQLNYGNTKSLIGLGIAALALVGALLANWKHRQAWAFILNGLCLAAAVAGLFLTLYPNVMPSTTNPAFSLTVDNASSTPYTLMVMTWVAVVMTPIVLVYQGWTYWIFRRRIGTRDIPQTTVGATL